ncbi:uncharacterized protein [Populus alba]|uniref:uncharacterized protein n=1 Tax=Populus alba TaxID=43335 RepID=UPI003CC7423C
MDLTTEDPYDVKFSDCVRDDKWTTLEERLRVVEGNDLFDPVRAAEDSLTGSALSWYMRLDNIRIKKWADLADAFLKQYKFNLKIALDRTNLMTMEKGNQESVRAYAQRWRDQAIHVHPFIIEIEMVTLFTNTFKAPYYEQLMGSSAQHFYDVVWITKKIEQGIQSGRIVEPVEKRNFVGGKKKEIEIALILVPPMQPPSLAWYNPEVTCEYHAGNAGHNIEICVAFKKRVLQLIKVGWVTFEDSPNVNINPLPKHTAGCSEVNAMEIHNKGKVLKVTMTRLYEMLVLSRHLEKLIGRCMGKSDSCPFHKKKGHHIDECIEFHQKVARMLTLGELRVEAIEDNGEIKMIKKCRVQSTANGLSNLVLTKGKEAIDFDKELEVNKPMTEEETNAFLKVMKHSEYCIVDQLKKTPAKIFIMSLILSSEPHRNALQKVLNEAYMPQDME